MIMQQENSFWFTLPRPIIAMAPMEDVTDTVFRELIMGISAKDCLHVVFTEFTSTDGLCNSRGREKVRHRLIVSEAERSLLEEKNVRIVAQLWGSEPEMFSRSARMVEEEGVFDGIDINMGCPVRKIINQGACSALIMTPLLAAEIIQAVKESTRLPVSVKTRIGFNSIETEPWIGTLLKQNPDAIIIHARVQSAESKGPVMWDEIKKSVDLRDQVASSTLILGNGDILSLAEARQKAAETGADGIMIGRGVFHNPWIFNHPQAEHSPDDKLSLLMQHTRLFTSTWKDEKNFDILKRFFRIYASGFPGASALRTDLMETRSMDEVEKVVQRFSPATPKILN